MAYGSVMSISNDSSEFNNAILKITGPKTGSTVTVTQGSTTITAKEDNGVWTAEVGKGSWVVKSGNGSTTVQVELSKVYEVALKMVSNILNENDWATIREVADNDEGATYWAVGDAKEIHIQGKIGLKEVNADFWVFILEFNHMSATQGEHLIHFAFARIFQTFSNNSGRGLEYDYSVTTYNNNQGAFTMNPASDYNSCTTMGGWENCHMRKVILGSDASTAINPPENTFLNALPSDLRAVMKRCIKYTDNVGGEKAVSANSVTATQEWCPLLNEFEITGGTHRTNSYEGNPNLAKQYEFYKIGLGVSARYRYGDLGTSGSQWLRSPGYSRVTSKMNGNDFCSLLPPQQAAQPSTEASARSLIIAPIFFV